ncbi:MAG TPA: hypothetical protein ENN39_12945 [Desulfonatronum sp.]|nr:hypothetical protein [Desulfonatronum sp.]
MYRSIVTALFVVLFWTSPVLAQETIGNVKSVSGQVEVQREDRIVTAIPGANLREGDILRTAENSAVGVIFLDGTRISVGPASEMVVSSFRFEPNNENYSFDIHMKKGSAVYSSGKLEKLAPEAVKFNTPQTTVGVRGTKFLVRID